MDGLEELTLVFPNPGLVWLFHQPGVFVDEPRLPENVSCGVFYLRPKKEQILAAAAQSCPTLCDPIESSPPGSSAHGIFQARILQWVAISYSIVYLGYSLNDEGLCSLANKTSGST